MPAAAVTVTGPVRLWPGEERESSLAEAAAWWFDGVTSGRGQHLPLQQEARVAAVLVVPGQAQMVQEQLAQAMAPPG
jgi:hypothetical protein